MRSTVDPIPWLLQGDAVIRWQTLRDLAGSPDSELSKVQARIARSGWGAQLLACRRTEGEWAGLYSPKWTSTTYTMLLLREYGISSNNRCARMGAKNLLDAGVYKDNGINFWLPRRKRSETCVTGMVLGIASRFTPEDARVDNLVEHLMEEQMADGGWNCLRRDGATHSSLHTSIIVLEGLLEYERSGGRLSGVARAARERGHEFLFVHRMFRSHRTGTVIDDRMTRFSFPPHWHYDVLRGLDYLRSADSPRDERLAEAIDLVRRRRGEDGTWLLQNFHRGLYHFLMEQQGQPSRWNTLRAMRVLKWWDS